MRVFDEEIGKYKEKISGDNKIIRQQILYIESYDKHAENPSEIEELSAETTPAKHNLVKVNQIYYELGQESREIFCIYVIKSMT